MNGKTLQLCERLVGRGLQKAQAGQSQIYNKQNQMQHNQIYDNKQIVPVKWKCLLGGWITKPAVPQPRRFYPLQILLKNFSFLSTIVQELFFSPNIAQELFFLQNIAQEFFLSPKYCSRTFPFSDFPPQTFKGNQEQHNPKKYSRRFRVTIR